MVTESLTTGSGEQAGPRGAFRQSPEGMSGGKEKEQLGLISPSQLSRDPLYSFSHRGQEGQNHRTSWLMPEGPPHTGWHVLLLLLLRTATGR